MKNYISLAILVVLPYVVSCTDETRKRNSEYQGWKPDLLEGEKLLRVVVLAPTEVMPLEGVIESPGIYGIKVREAWELRDREKADGRKYCVYLRSPLSSPDRPNMVGTTYAASSKFNPGEGITYEVANETPISVTVAICTKK